MHPVEIRSVGYVLGVNDKRRQEAGRARRLQSQATSGNSTMAMASAIDQAQLMAIQHGMEEDRKRAEAREAMLSEQLRAAEERAEVMSKNAEETAKEMTSMILTSVCIVGVGLLVGIGVIVGLVIRRLPSQQPAMQVHAIC